MTKVFIGGSRKISKLGTKVRKRLDRIMARRLLVLVGDANGTDRAVQQYFQSKDYDLVEVFCAGAACRNNTGGWPVRKIPADETRRDFSFFTTKDRVMAEEASVGFMIWDGKSVGTLMNVLRLARRAKKAVVYITSVTKFVNVKSEGDLQQLAARCAPELRKRLEREATAEQETDQASKQMHLI